MSPTINDPEIIREITALHERYETALVANDVDTLNQLFWDSALAVRFGATEALYGTVEIAAFRRARPAVDLARTVSTLKVVAFGEHTAVTTLEFERKFRAFTRSGRQTQVWQRLEEGWKIVSGHVSFKATPGWVDEAARLMELPIPERFRAGVELNVERARQLANAVLSFPIDEHVEAAPVFRP